MSMFFLALSGFAVFLIYMGASFAFSEWLGRVASKRLARAGFYVHFGAWLFLGWAVPCSVAIAFIEGRHP